MKIGYFFFPPPTDRAAGRLREPAVSGAQPGCYAMDARRVIFFRSPQAKPGAAPSGAYQGRLVAGLVAGVSG